MKKIFFHSTALTVHRPVSPPPYSLGTPQTAVSSISQMRPGFSLTGNKGNMVHSEAVLKLFSHNHSRSALGNLVHLHKAYGNTGLRDYLRDHYDLAILSMANFVRPGMDHSSLASALENIDIPIVVFSAGIQNLLPSFDSLSDSTKSLLTIFNEKSILFSVRGEQTKEFLDDCGIGNTVVLGCPSLYVYPLNILSIGSAQYSASTKIVTSGHLSKNNLDGSRSNFVRAQALLTAFKDQAADYVFQDEIFSFDEILDQENVYDDANSMFRGNVINEYFRAKLSISLPFRNYFFFNDVSAWRQYLRQADVYVGDRFHGGVVALQAGRPAIFVAGDKRIDELTDFFGIPKTSFRELRLAGIASVIDEKCSDESLVAFKRVYKTRLTKFVQLTEGIGMTLANRSAILSALQVPA